MFRRSADIHAILEDLAGDMPDLVTTIPLRPSQRRRLPISAIRIRGGDGGERPGVLFVGGIHARELLNPDLLTDLAIDLLSHYLSGSDWVMGGQRWPAETVQAIVETLDVFLLANANPDGREHVFDTDRLWRKNRRNNPGTFCDGVDLNRNFRLLWGIQTRDASGSLTTTRNPCTNTFVGSRALSEPETRNVKQLMDDHPIECFVDVHSYSELILHPWGHAPNQTIDDTQRFTLVDTSDWEVLPDDAPGHEEFIAPEDLSASPRSVRRPPTPSATCAGATTWSSPGPTCTPPPARPATTPSAATSPTRPCGRCTGSRSRPAHRRRRRRTRSSRPIPKPVASPRKRPRVWCRPGVLGRAVGLTTRPGLGYPGASPAGRARPIVTLPRVTRNPE